MESKIANLKMIVGLGNPGDEYTGTYHSVGRLFLDFLAGEGATWKKTDSFRYRRDAGVILAESDVFMNESGRAARKALSFFKLKPGDVAIAHDDSDLPLGEYKIQFGRGSAGHNGVASVIAHFKTRDFIRIRIGIRKEDGRTRKKAGDFVLRKIGTAERKILDGVFRAIASEIERERD